MGSGGIEPRRAHTAGHIRYYKWCTASYRPVPSLIEILVCKLAKKSKEKEIVRICDVLFASVRVQILITSLIFDVHISTSRSRA
jgi:hypothetical protein